MYSTSFSLVMSSKSYSLIVTIRNTIAMHTPVPSGLNQYIKASKFLHFLFGFTITCLVEIFAEEALRCKGVLKKNDQMLSQVKGED